jgi:hypothetical protein
VDCVPLKPLAPDQPPEAVHAVAFVDDHVRVEDWPLPMVLGLALSVTCGAGAAVTVTVAV